MSPDLKVPRIVTLSCPLKRQTLQRRFILADYIAGAPISAMYKSLGLARGFANWSATSVSILDNPSYGQVDQVWCSWQDCYLRFVMLNYGRCYSIYQVPRHLDTI